MSLAWKEKLDPDEELDYQVDWTDWLDGDTITTSTFVVPVGITKITEQNTTTTSTVWVTGGTPGQAYPLVNTITTAGGRTGERTVKIKVKER